MAKELADSARRLASRAYHSNDYASQEKAALHAIQTAVGEDLQLKCAERSCRTLEMAVETEEIQERYTKKAVQALKQEESELALYLKVMGEKLEALMGEIKDDRDQRKQWAALWESGRRRKADMGSGVSILAAGTWRKWGRAEDKLTRYWGQLCSVEGKRSGAWAEQDLP